VIITSSDKLRFWEVGSPVDYAVLAEQARQANPAPPDPPAGAVAIPRGFEIEKQAQQTSHTDRPGRGKYSDKDVNPATAWKVVEERPTPLTIIKSEPLPAGESRSSKILGLAGLLFLPPAIGYIMLFHVLRWVYRGFRPAALGVSADHQSEPQSPAGGDAADKRSKDR